MLDYSKKTTLQKNTTEAIDAIMREVYLICKPLGFRKHGRTLHRFVDGDISQVINFQCGQAYLDATHLMWVNVGIRVPECTLHAFHADENQKKYYHEYECNIRSRLGSVKPGDESCYDLRGDPEKIIADIKEQLRQYVLPVFDELNSREAILMKRRLYPHFDLINAHLILLEEAMMLGKSGDIEQATSRLNEYYRSCISQNRPSQHIEYIRNLAKRLNIEIYQ